jgi:hypothetical protein
MTFRFTKDTPDESAKLLNIFRDTSPATRAVFLRALALDPERQELHRILSELNTELNRISGDEL